MHNTRSDTSEAVDAFVAGLDHPAKGLVEMLRATILDADPSISEGVKWNAPSFKTAEYFATTNLRTKTGVGLVLHFGARAREVEASAATIADPTRILKWVARDRAVVEFADTADLTSQAPALQAVLRQWITHV